jgi:SAM-dependent methyltransferase
MGSVSETRGESTIDRSRRFDAFYSQADPYQSQTYFPERFRLQRTFDWVSGRRYAAILDLGAGDGSWTARLATLSPCVVASDISHVAMRRAAASYGDRLHCVVADLGHLSFAAERFDLITCMTGLGCLPPALRTDAVEAMHRALRPGGNLLVVDAIGPDKFRPGEIGRMLADRFAIERTAAANLRIPVLGRLATRFRVPFAGVYEALMAIADYAPERLARHVIVWAVKRA